MAKKRSDPKLVLPLAMDFCSPQSEEFTRISKFFDELRKGKFVTTKCKKCGTLSWPPRVVCPECQADELRWVGLPTKGKLWAFTELCIGAPMGMEQDLPFALGIVELDKIGLRLLTRIDTPFKDLKLDMPMELFVMKLPGNKIFFRFKAKRKR